MSQYVTLPLFKLVKKATDFPNNPSIWCDKHPCLRAEEGQETNWADERIEGTQMNLTGCPFSGPGADLCPVAINLWIFLSRKWAKPTHCLHICSPARITPCHGKAIWWIVKFRISFTSGCFVSHLGLMVVWCWSDKISELRLWLSSVQIWTNVFCQQEKIFFCVFMKHKAKNTNYNETAKFRDISELNCIENHRFIHYILYFMIEFNNGRLLITLWLFFHTWSSLQG